MKKRQMKKLIKKAAVKFESKNLYNESGEIIGKCYLLPLEGQEISKNKDPELFNSLYLGIPWTTNV